MNDMRLYVYLFAMLMTGALFVLVFGGGPDPAAESRAAFLDVCEGSPAVRGTAPGVDQAAMACTCIAAWHVKAAKAGALPFFPTQLYILAGGDVGAGLSDTTIATDAKARKACLK